MVEKGKLRRFENDKIIEGFSQDGNKWYEEGLCICKLSTSFLLTSTYFDEECLRNIEKLNLIRKLKEDTIPWVKDKISNKEDITKVNIGEEQEINIIERGYQFFILNYKGLKLDSLIKIKNKTFKIYSIKETKTQRLTETELMLLNCWENIELWFDEVLRGASYQNNESIFLYEIEKIDS